MTETKRHLKVFLCHAHSDASTVGDLSRYLMVEGIDVWLDKEKLLPGAEWDLEIRKAVRESDVVVVCLSKQFNREGYRQKEVRLALDAAMEKPEGEIFIIPARLEECDTLESLKKWHWVDLFEDSGRRKLISALRARADSVGAVLLSHSSLSPAALLAIQELARKLEKPKRNPNIRIDDTKNVWRDELILGSLEGDVEYAILKCLIENNGSWCSYSDFFLALKDVPVSFSFKAFNEIVYERSMNGFQRRMMDNVVRPAIEKIRALVEADPKNPQIIIQTPEVLGLAYKLSIWEGEDKLDW